MLSTKSCLHASVILLSCVLLAACRPASQAQTIVEMVEANLVSVTITGVGMDAVALRIQNTSPRTQQVEIPAGTYFVADNPSVQNMVARHRASASIEAGATAEIKLDAACASLHLAAPGATDTFAMVRAPELPELARVIDQLNAAAIAYPVEQAAVWIVTDDASYDELGMLVGGSPFGPPLIEEEDAVRAMMVVEQAGVDIRKYSIWRDHFALLSEVSDPELMAWLVEPGAAAATSAPAKGIEATARPSAADGGTEISQFAYQAFGSSELSSTDWSAMQATGAPNTSGCGHLPTAWSSAQDMPGAVLTLFFEQAVIPTRLIIHETNNPGAIFMVEAPSYSGGIPIYQGSSTLTDECPHRMIIEIAAIDEPVGYVTLTLDQENEAWDEIDAVELIGIRP